MGLSTAAAPLFGIASLLLLAQRREKDLRKQNNSQKKEKIKNSLSCPEPRKESKQPLLQMTLLPASCREAGVFITTTGAEGRAALRGPVPRSHPHCAGVPRRQSWLTLRVPVGLQVHTSLTPWAKVSLPRAGSGWPRCRVIPTMTFSRGFLALGGLPQPHQQHPICWPVSEEAGRERGGGAEHRPSFSSSGGACAMGCEHKTALPLTRVSF